MVDPVVNTKESKNHFRQEVSNIKVWVNKRFQTGIQSLDIIFFQDPLEENQLNPINCLPLLNSKIKGKQSQFLSRSKMNLK